MQSYILFHAGTSRYALELDKVERILMIPPINPSASQSIIDGIFDYEGSVIKVVNFRKMISLESYEDELQRSFQTIKQQHIEWIDALKDALENDTLFTKTKDPHMCDLGKWLDEFNSYNDKVMKTIKELNHHHQNLHKSAHELCKLKKSDINAARTFFESEIKAHYQKTLSYLEQLITQLHEVADDKIDDIIHIDKSSKKSQERVKKSNQYIDIAGVLEYKDILNSVIENIKVSQIL
jgi:gas vesicle protein